MFDFYVSNAYLSSLVLSLPFFFPFLDVTHFRTFRFFFLDLYN